MLRLIYLFLFFSLIFSVSYSQTPNSDSSKIGKVEVVQDAKINELVTKYILLKSQDNSIPGYRIQIHFGGEREKAKEIKTKFLKTYPEFGAYESYQQPNFRIRVGDFRTKLEAQKFLKEISSTFNSSFIVTDDIQPPSMD